MQDSGKSSRRRMLGIGAALGGGLLAAREHARAAENAPGQLGIPPWSVWGLVTV